MTLRAERMALAKASALPADDQGTAGGIEGPGGAKPASEGGHVATLDGVRGLAVLAVILFHSIYNFQPANRVEAVVDPLFEAGWAGVDLFFVLSGFLITGILIRSKGRPRYYRNFMIRRALRIMPLYYVYVALTLWVFPAVGIVSAPDAAVMRDRQAWVWTFLTNFMLVHFGANAGVHLSHLWSVAVEEQFYLAWPLVVALLSTRSLRRLCIAIVVVAPALRLAASVAGVDAHSINWLTPLRLDALALGGLAAIMVR